MRLYAWNKRVLPSAFCEQEPSPSAFLSRNRSRAVLRTGNPVKFPEQVVSPSAFPCREPDVSCSVKSVKESVTFTHGSNRRYLAHSEDGVGLLAHSSTGTGAGPSAEPVLRFASQSRCWNPSAFLHEEPDPGCSVQVIGKSLCAILFENQSQYQTVRLSVAPELPRRGMRPYPLAPSEPQSPGAGGMGNIFVANPIRN